MVSLDFCISVVKAGKEMEGIKQKKKKNGKKRMQKVFALLSQKFCF